MRVRIWLCFRKANSIQLDELEDIRLYDEAQREDDSERIPMDEAFKLIEAKRK